MPDGMTNADAHAYLEDHGWIAIAMAGSVVWGRSADNDPFALDDLLLTVWAAVALQERHRAGDTTSLAQRDRADAQRAPATCCQDGAT